TEARTHPNVTIGRQLETLQVCIGQSLAPLKARPIALTSKDQATGKEQQVRIEQSSGLSDDDISRMKEDAEKFKEQDEVAKSAAEKRNAADQMVHQARKMMSEHEDKLEEADKEAVETKITAVTESLQGEDLDVISNTTEALQQQLSQLGEKLYAAASAQGPGAAPEAPAGGAGTGGDDVVDADYEVKD
ncbi:MAG: Hsp70 family protein, partial [Planctomycetes bacterium]|nr:Hsp70 family protein [Planctomycetota bacterium]